MKSYLQRHRHAIIIALLGFIVSLGLFYGIQIQEEHYLLNIAQLGIETIDNHIQSELSFDAHLLRHIANQPNPAKPAPKDFIHDLLFKHNKVLALANVNANKINWIQGKDDATNYRPLFEQLINNPTSNFKKNSSNWITSPVNLSPDLSGFFMVQAAGPSSYVIALIDCKALMHRQAKLPGMEFQIYVNQQAIAAYPPNKYQQWLFEVSQDLFGASIDIKAQEAVVNLGIIHLISSEAPLSWITFILGILISLLLARSTDLSDQLKERTLVLDNIIQELQDEITSHLETESSKKNLEKALLQGQKLQAIGTLAGGIAHDFNNLLYAIRGYAELGRDEIPKDQITYANLGKILDATYRGQDLISQILTFSRRQQHEYSPLNLKKEIEGALALLRPTVPQTVDLQFESSVDGHIMGNKTQIHQIIVNLINNAVDAMEGEGRILITLSPVDMSEAGQLKNSALKTQNYCKITVSDTGHGMDQTTMDRIFEPFYTTKEVGKGTGLGLSTVHSIVKDHLGEILVNSHIGKGTTFTIFFPERITSQKEQHHG